ncbi:MAG: ABC transporter permease [Anaerolineae bacterium]|jgi:putative ABC transport system permease protein
MGRVINLWFAMLGLRANKLRSALTILGIVIGVTAVIMIVALGNGLRRSTEEQMEAFSQGTIEVRPSMAFARPMAVGMSGGAVVVESEKMGGGGMRMPQLNSKDVEALDRLGTTIDGVSPQYETYGTLVYQGKRLDIGQIIGATPSYLQVYEREMLYGRFLNPVDEQGLAPVMVIDEMASDRVFGEGVDPVGNEVVVSFGQVPQVYTIIGVLASDGGYSRTSYAALVPLRTAQRRLNNSGEPEPVSFIAVGCESRDDAQRRKAVAEVNTILRASRGIEPGVSEDFYVNDTLAFREESMQVIRLITLVLSLIAGISLAVGSIGLMNIMLVSVSERTAEIGVRRAMGAQRGDILAHFLWEAIMLGLVGGVTGLLLGSGGSYLVGALVEELQGKIAVTWDIIAIAVGVSTVVGVAAGIYPAWRAALLQPTEALRHV